MIHTLEGTFLVFGSSSIIDYLTQTTEEGIKISAGRMMIEDVPFEAPVHISGEVWTRIILTAVESLQERVNQLSDYVTMQ